MQSAPDSYREAKLIPQQQPAQAQGRSERGENVTEKERKRESKKQTEKERKKESKSKKEKKEEEETDTERGRE